MRIVSKTSLKRKNGITIISLVITIVILIILATITINVAFGEGGLIERAQQAKKLTEQATKDEEEKLNAVMSEYANIMGEKTEISEPNLNEVDPEPVEPEPSEVEIAKENGTVFEETKQIEDEHGNKITIPEGFKIAGGENGSGDTVQQGIVIEDAFSEDVNVRGSQYVWIPVGTFTKDDGKPSNEIVLGRYTFADDEYGTPQLQQAAYTEENPENYKTPVEILDPDGGDYYYSELVEYRVGVEDMINGLNATAYNLEAWINSVKNNGGYYIARYEASYASGSSTADYKCASKESNGYSDVQMSYTAGTLWNYITQLDASKVAINTYKDSNNGVKSDLMNSYAWDTAIVFIQECGYTNYANQRSKKTSLADTGTNSDEVCKINDLASNCYEWTTEYSSYTYRNIASPCVLRGGVYSHSFYYAAHRNDYYATDSSSNVSFRPSLYLVDLNVGE